MFKEITIRSGVCGYTQRVKSVVALGTLCCFTHNMGNQTECKITNDSEKSTLGKKAGRPRVNC